MGKIKVVSMNKRERMGAIMQMKVSIIIPTWNRAQYVGRAIESALMQDYGNLEVVIADNASTDNTSEVVKQYLVDSRVRYFCNAINIGATENFQQALHHQATGEYAMFLCDDDFLIDFAFISKAMKLVEEDQEVALVFANYQHISLETGAVLAQARVSMPSNKMDGKWVWINYCKGFFCPLVSTVFSRRIAMMLGGSYVDIPSGDMLLFLLILLNGKAGFIPDIVASYAIHEDNHFKRINKQGDIQALYDDLDFIRIPAKYAIKKGLIDKAEVQSWKKRMMVTRMREHITDYCLHDAQHGDYSKLSHLYFLAKEGGEMDYFFEALSLTLVSVLPQASSKI